MALLVCGADCAPLSWDFIALHLAAGAALWGLLLLLGRAFAVYAACRDLRALKERVELRRRRLNSSPVQCILRLALALAQCALFCIRTYTKAVSEFDWLFEMGVCVVYLLDLALDWLESHLNSKGAGARFVCLGAPTDCLLVCTVPLMALPVRGARSWCSLSFLAAVNVARYWERLFQTSQQVRRWDILDVVVSTVTAVLFAAMAMLTLENLGDPEVLRKINEDEWNIFSSVYYVVSTVSTVGYSGLSPSTVLGRCFAIVILSAGMSLAVTSLRKVNQVVILHNSGGGYYERGARDRHVVVSGNLTAETAKDLIVELFHPDHAEDAESLHAVLLLPPGAGVAEAVNRFLGHKSNVLVADRVHVFQGSVMQDADLERVHAAEAEAFFLFPDLQCSAPLQEDTESIIRCMAVRRFAPTAKIILLLMKAESRLLIAEMQSSGENDVMCVAVDQTKLSLAGKSCEVTGFATLMCNLIKCVGDKDEPEEEDEADEDAQFAKFWRREYENGLKNELYEVPLSNQYCEQEALFFEVVLDVLARTEGRVCLVGLMEVTGTEKRIVVNPGPKYPIRSPMRGVRTSGVFIAPDREAVVQCTQKEVLLCGDMTPGEEEDREDWASARRRAHRLETVRGSYGAAPEIEAVELPEEDVSAGLLGSLEGAERRKVRQLVGLVRQKKRASHPPRPSARMLAKGGHILFMCTGASDVEVLRLGVEHFVKPLRQRHHEASLLVPVVVLAPVFPEDWENVASQKEVYFLNGSPLSEFDVDRANAQAASAVFICNVGGSAAAEGHAHESWRLDSETICCSRLVEARLATSEASVVAELAAESNHVFIPVWSTPVPYGGSRITGSFSSPSEALLGRARPRALMDRALELLGAAFGKSHASGARKGEEGWDAFKQGPKPLDYFRQPRFASGQLLTAGVITSLVVNSFYNPSLCEMVSKMISSNVIMVSVVPSRVGRPYLDYFKDLFWVDGLLPIAILRQGRTNCANSGKTKRRSVAESGFGHQVVGNVMQGLVRRQRFAFVYTAPPPQETLLLDSDRIICFATALRRS